MIRFFVLFFLIGGLSAQDFTTHRYRPGLELDLFLPDEPINDSLPLVIFVHGGGFSGGTRDGGHALGRHLAQRNIATASISYTLHMAGRTQDWGCDGILTEKVRTIQLAANDLWAATAWLVKKARRFGIDSSRIFIAGSSAGGETILHAAFWDREALSVIKHGLSEDFRYAGLSSGAGAIMDLNLIKEENAIPSQFFHGARDPVVPYATAAHHFCPVGSSGWLMLFGSAPIAEKIGAAGKSYELVTHPVGEHEIAGHYFERQPGRIGDFVEWVVAGKRFQFRQEVW